MLYFMAKEEEKNALQRKSIFETRFRGEKIIHMFKWYDRKSNDKIGEQKFNFHSQTFLKNVRLYGKERILHD